MSEPTGRKDMCWSTKTRYATSSNTAESRSSLKRGDEEEARHDSLLKSSARLFVIDY